MWIAQDQSPAEILSSWLNSHRVTFMWDQLVPGPRPLNGAHWVLCDALRMVAGAGFGFVRSLRVFDSPGPNDLGTELPGYAGTSCCNWEPECHLSRELGSLLVLS